MSKRKVGETEEQSKELPITAKEVAKYREGIKGLSQRVIGKQTVPRFDQLMDKWGFARLDEDGYTTVVNVTEFHYWTRVRDSVGDYDHAMYMGAIEQVPGEREAHQQKVKSWSRKLAAIFAGK